MATAIMILVHVPNTSPGIFAFRPIIISLTSSNYELSGTGAKPSMANVHLTLYRRA